MQILGGGANRFPGGATSPPPPPPPPLFTGMYLSLGELLVGLILALVFLQNNTFGSVPVVIVSVVSA